MSVMHPFNQVKVKRVFSSNCSGVIQPSASLSNILCVNVGASKIFSFDKGKTQVLCYPHKKKDKIVFGCFTDEVDELLV